MRYDIRQQQLEKQFGITYHRTFSNFLIAKTNDSKLKSILITGEDDGIISFFLAKSGKFVHVLDNDMYTIMARLSIVTEDSFPLMDYDVVICLFCDMETIKKYINCEKWIFFPCIDVDVDKFTSLLRTSRIPFSSKRIDGKIPNGIAYYNF